MPKLHGILAKTFFEIQGKLGHIQNLNFRDFRRTPFGDYIIQHLYRNNSAFRYGIIQTSIYFINFV